MTGKRPPRSGRGGWWVALAAVSVLCCAGPAVLAALGAGSLGAAVGSTTGNVALAVVGVLVAAVALLVLLRRGERR